MSFFRKKIITPFVALLIALGVGAGSWGVTTLVSGGSAAQTADLSIEALYADSIEDAMVAQPEEIEPLVSLTKESDMVTWNEKGDKVLLLSWHKYPESYVEGSEISLEYGPVWTFTDKEIAHWYSKNKAGVTDWDMRLRQLIGLTPDSMYTHMTAFWADPKDVLRPAYNTDITTDKMSTTFEAEPDEAFHAWFNGNIISSYYEGGYPWTRLGYTYDWANNGKEYGLTEFLIAENAPVTVEFTKTTADFLSWLDTVGK